MAYRVATDCAAAVGKMASRQVRPCLATRPSAHQPQPTPLDAALVSARRCAVSMVSAGVALGLILAPEPAMATVMGVAQAPAAATSSAPASSSRSQLLPMPLAAPPPLASTAASAAASAVSGAVLVVEEAEELVLDAVHFFQHGVEAVGSTVHHLQVVHALERLESMPFNQVVDLELLKAAMHPAPSLYDAEYDGDDGDRAAAATASTAASDAAARRLDAALDSVAGMRLREVVDVGKLADALQDVQLSGPLDGRSLQREAIRLRRSVHWEAVAEAVRPAELRRALSALGAVHRGGSPFSEMDIRAAVSAVRMDVVRQVLTPPKSAPKFSTHSLESSGMWTWESM
ncbi:hypothetical protein PLESTB_001516700 [Pleodorina starrii]|uniref:Uncharacterized protein n=1 Tax=Pleodorina starrii TaxID=330485 RepID=A0A9W6F7S9_9CHLO|nr:hypothetical protein PLESTM_001047000 [Pleodorina starrii]GLC59637.1 hypothetical protein PLESTB_001516700 [Pleodorina starrii]GLC74605.1 hypothetical protein PLESTF_001534300 [Pleodorina starrii]